MKRYNVDGGIPTLAVALSEHMRADELRKLASLTSGPVPTRKAEIVDLIANHLEGTRLRTAWQSLDELQKALVAEVVHSPGTQFPADRFQAKYGRAPSWGSLDTYRRDERPTALRFFFYGGEGGSGVMPDDLKERLEAFVPPPALATVKSLAELPAVYERPWERWNPTTKKKEQGTESIPLTVRESERAAQRELLSVLRLVDAGKVAELIECAEPALAALIANDTRTRTHCLRAGERHLAVPASSDAAFRRALRELGYLLASGETRATKGRRASTSDAPGPRATEA